ncbi:MAG: type 1 glutamine amidotransferase [Candidatus Nitrosotenuis sp.]
MSKVLVIKNARLEGPGTIGELLEADGFTLQTVFAKKEKLPPLDHSAVLVLGAPESANDDLQYLRDEMELIRTATQKNIPTLGICLGSQLIAKAFGAQVYKGPQKEIGFYHDVKIDPAANSRLFSGISDPFTVFHWHGDTFDLPKNSTRLAYSKMYNQAFLYGSAVAIQFHFEVNKEIITAWLDTTKEDLNDIDPNKIRDQIDANIENVQTNMKIFYKNFKSVFNL